MGDFPKEWTLERDLVEGGQAHTFVVHRTNNSDSKQYVLKRLKNSDRADRFEQEIETYRSLDHPNILKLVEDGSTPKLRRYLITEFCSEGSLASRDKFALPLDGLRFFEKIVAAIAYAHTRVPATYHLDLKPENILLKDSHPLVGDFGICYIENGKLNLTSEGPHGSIYYCAPELRGPRRIEGTPLGATDVYSLGKILYWLFTKDVYDREDDYSKPEFSLAHLYPSFPRFAFIDELIQKSIQYKPTDRYSNAKEFLQAARRVIERIEAGGRLLDLRVPQRCLYCAEGHYRTIHDEVADPYMARPHFPEIEKRKRPIDDRIYGAIRAAADHVFRITRTGTREVGIPLMLICDYCGNVQYFRLDMTTDKYGENWRP